MNITPVFTDYTTEHLKNQVLAVFNCFQIGNPAKVPDHGKNWLVYIMNNKENITNRKLPGEGRRPELKCSI